MSSLVSVIIVAYNSSRFIKETLESVLKQTWKEIELIITDDCSGDDTIEICRNWLKKNKNRFFRVEIISSKKNSGVPANANRGLQAATGDWIKFLGADDTLLPDCISYNMQNINKNPGIRVLLSKVNVYQDSFQEKNFVLTTPGEITQDSIIWPARTAESQYRMLLLFDRIHFSPSEFLHRETILSVGGFDERFRLLEDYPLWLNLTKNGHKLYFMDKVTVNYRRHSKSIYNTGNRCLIKPNYFNEKDFRKIYIYPNMPVDIRLNTRFYWYVSQVFRCKWLNRNTAPNRFLLAILTVYLNPFRYFIWIRKRLNKNLENNEFYI